MAAGRATDVFPAEVTIQILIVLFGGTAFQVTSLNSRDWGMSIALGFVSLPLGFVIRCIPTPPVERLGLASLGLDDLFLSYGL